MELPRSDEFELKRAACDLFDEPERFGYSTVVRLEFKRGLPCRLETTAHVTPGARGAKEPPVSGKGNRRAWFLPNKTDKTVARQEVSSLRRDERAKSDFSTQLEPA